MNKALVIRDESIRARCMSLIADLPIDPPYAVRINLYDDPRSLEQNAKLWAMLEDVAEQVEWYGKKLTAWDWKDVMTSALIKANVVPNLDGTGFVACGLHTSKLGKKRMSELIELIDAFAAEKGVRWSDETTG